MSLAEIVWTTNILLGTGAFGGTVFRTITRWHVTGPLAHYILTLLCCWTLIIVLGTGASAAEGMDFNPAHYAIAIFLLAQIVLVAQWSSMETLTIEEMRRRVAAYDSERTA